MSYKNRPPALSGNVNTWAERLNDWLVKNQDKLSYYLAGQSAAEDGILMWDADNSQVVVSSGGSWVALTGGGGGTITNYLRDDADDSTNFRLTMGGLTVDTDTLYVDSVNNEVGIGTTNPSEKLEVVGNVEATEFIGDLRGAVVFKAQAGEALTKGEVVYISGISGNTTVVSKADADDAAKMQGFGLAATDANNNANLEVYTFGTLHGLDTSSYALGAELYVSTTAGQLTDTPPTGESAALQKIAKVTRVHATSGSLKIMGAGRTNATPNLNDGNIFIGNSSNQAVTASFTTEVANATTGKADLSGAAFTGDVSVDGTVTADALTVDTDTLYVDATNNKVGIGTTTPASALTVKSSSFSQLRLEDDDDSLQIGYSSASAYIKTGDNNTKINFRKTNNTDVMTVDMATERVGIGATSPATKLDVNGTITANGISLGDSESIAVGADDDFTIAHDGTDTTIQNDTGDLIVDVNDVAGKLELQHEGVRAFTITDQEANFYMGSATFPKVSISSTNPVTFFTDITMYGTTTVDGRNVSVDGARLDTIPYHRVRHERLRHSAKELTLTTNYQNISQAYYIYSPATPVDCSRYIDIELELEWRYVSSNTNDTILKIEVTVPSGSATVTNLGTATVISGGLFVSDTYENWSYFSGDYTHLLTRFGRLNKTGSSGASEMQARAWHYDPSNDRTYILADSNPTVSISTGDTVYWHPYAWESAGTNLFLEIQFDERYVSIGRQQLSKMIKIAYDNELIVIKGFMREVSTSDSAILYGAEATMTDVGEV